ncbi:hypothetical protein FRC07_003915 [Ceratobasidium sp. 392]|nr:hypothetical protein FRC07_003915 [Ceratobasidium sp. 392]
MPAPKTLRPSIDDFRRFGWLPKDQQTYDDWMNKLVHHVESKTRGTPAATPYSGVDLPDLLEPIQEFKKAIETNAVIFTDIVRMFEGMTESPKTYQEMLLMFNKIFREAPSFGSLGPPMYMIMARVMNTQGGFSAFTKQALNHHFKKMLKTWEAYLVSKDSTSVLNTGPDGWLSTAAISKMLENYSNRSFDQVFICDTALPAFGFVSYEDFFVRRYRNPQIDRPTGDLDNLEVISAPCESALYAIQKDVQKTDELFIKDEAYSLVHLLANDESVDYFVGGTVIQTFLDTKDYHRWHTPVNGVIQKIVDVPGTYFAQAPSTLGEETGPNDLPPFLKSLTYFANTATRQLIFIQADNPKIGLMVFIAIGMTEISSCESTVFEGQKVRRGDELGMFHFGGSSSAMVFRKDANIQVDGDYQKPGTPYPINAVIAVADPPSAS